MDTFEASYPILELIDRDADGVADEFACLPEINSPDTLEFGVIFDLDGEKPWGAETQFDSGNVGNMILSDIVFDWSPLVCYAHLSSGFLFSCAHSVR